MGTMKHTQDTITIGYLPEGMGNKQNKKEKGKVCGPYKQTFKIRIALLGQIISFVYVPNTNLQPKEMPR